MNLGDHWSVQIAMLNVKRTPAWKNEREIGRKERAAKGKSRSQNQINATAAAKARNDFRREWSRNEVLRYLQVRGRPASCSEISGALQLDKRHCAHLADDLVQQGLVIKTVVVRTHYWEAVK